jgi:hypothetical protein
VMKNERLLAELLGLSTLAFLMDFGSCPGAFWRCAAALDYLENLFPLRILLRLPEPLNFTARMAGICTSLKMPGFIAALGALAAALSPGRPPPNSSSRSNFLAFNPPML